MRPVRALLDAELVHGLAHITGGGLPGNVPRVLPRDLAVTLDAGTWPRPPIFDLVATAGIDTSELYCTFNMGLGMVAFVRESEAQTVVETLARFGVDAFVAGEVHARKGGDALRITGVESA